MQIVTEYIGSKGILGPRIKATVKGLKTGNKQTNAYMDFDDSISSEERHRKTAQKLLEKLSRTLGLVGKLQLVNNRVPRPGFTFNIVQ